MKDGETVKEKNLRKKHNIPIDTLVEIKYDNWYGGGACEIVHARLWVIDHDRDCDGTPLYTLANAKADVIRAFISEWKITKKLAEILCGSKNGFPEESLTVIKITPELENGEGALTAE